MGGTLVRSVGLVRAKARIGLKNLAYNMRRLVQTGASRGDRVTILGEGDRLGTVLWRKQLNWSVGRLPKILGSQHGWRLVTTWLNNHPPATHQFLEVPIMNF